MKLSRSLQYIVVFAVVAAAVLVAGWFLLLSPRLEAAAATRQDTRDMQASNSALSARVAAIGKLDQAELKSRVASLHAQIPDDLALTELTRELAGFADSAGVTVVSVERAPGEPTTVAGTVASPLTVTIKGSESSVKAFLTAAQKSDKRLLLITGLSTQPSDDHAVLELELQCNAFLFDGSAAGSETGKLPGVPAWAEPQK